MRLNLNDARPRAVLIAHDPSAEGLEWIDEVRSVLEPDGLLVRRTHSAEDTARCVERGGLAAAVLVAGGGRMNGLSVLRIVRSIDVVLPCWLVALRTDRSTLQAALALRVTSVIAQPAEAMDIARALRTVIVDA